MKIGFLTPEYPHPKTGSSGGIGTSIMNLAKGLVQLGEEVVILIYGQQEDAVFEEKGITFYKIKNVKIKGLSLYLTQKKIEKRINTLVKSQKLDIVEAPDWTGITSFINPICPLVIRLNGTDTYFCHLDSRPVKPINRFHEKRALQNADALLSVSAYTAAVTKELFGLDRDFTIIHNSIDLQQFDSEISQNTIIKDTILYFGTLIRKKGLLELPLIFNAVFKKNPQAKLILVGKDAKDIISGNLSTFKMMQSLFDADAYANVTYLGSVPYDAIKRHIATSAVCVFPTFAEALPVSWIEAMAMKKPIVASNIGWATEVIDNEIDGFLVDPKQHSAYADKILELLENTQLCESFGNQARKKVQNKFGIDVIARESLEFYKQTVKK